MIENHYEVDIAIVGAGAAGITGGIEVLDAGAKCIAFEKLAEAGGAAAISGGGCCIVGSPVQKKAGIQDTPDLAFDDWMAWGGSSADAVWARYYLEHTLYDLYYWAEQFGVKWLDMKPQEGNTVTRWTRPAGNGKGLMTNLIKAYLSKGGEIINNVQVNQITQTNGKVSGLIAANTVSGEKITVEAGAVIITSGGFNSNIDMVLKAKPELKEHRVMVGSGFGSHGDGHKMVKKVGGYLTHMNHVWFYCYSTPDYKDQKAQRGLVCRHIPGYIWVNQQGKRFHNESLSGGNTMSPAVLRQSPPHCWAIVDTPMKKNLEIADPYYRNGDKIIRENVEELLNNSPFIQKANNLETLAKKINVPVNAFIGEIEAYNTAILNGLENDPAFGKPLKNSKAFDTPPYYAIQFFPTARKNFGGIKTDKKCRVLDKHFEPIPKLFAAGEACGMAGGHINGKAGLEGTMLGPSLFSGRVAGAWAAELIGFGNGFTGRPNR
ncbi:MAG: hypothetical protein CMM44_10085 [Rhodospirillaceae bacterium]|nr:hypothetical protein [Rhodospirillaceae bacterium]